MWHTVTQVAYMEIDLTANLEIVPTKEIPVENIILVSDRLKVSESRWRRITWSIITQLFQCALIAGLVAGIYWLVSQHLYQTIQVEGLSMYPTLRNSDHYFLNRWIYHVRDPRTSEIVVLKDPQDSVYEVKRVIATGGESVCIKKGAVYVNGERLKESYLAPGTKTYAVKKNPDEFICCGRDQFYVLGDNRNISRDSRYFGPVRRENILGKLVF